MKRILLAEDERLILETIAMNLSREGYEVIKAVDGSDCLSKLETHEVDLLITDIHMPVLTGLEVVSKLKNSDKKEIPIIILSSNGAEESVLKAFDMGVDDYMVKPVSLSEMNVRVKKLLSQNS